MKNKVISGIIVSTLISASILASVNADFGEFREKGFKKGGMIMKGLSDDEKTSLESMTIDEKKEFFTEKNAERQVEMEEKKAERESHEAVIDKLIDGEELTADDKVILEEIKVKRAERKLNRENGEKGRRGEGCIGGGFGGMGIHR